MAEFESGWPTNFNKTPNKNVTLMISTKKSIKLDGKPVYDTELIYTLLMCIQQYRYIDITCPLRTRNFPQCKHHYLMRVVLCGLNHRQS